MVYSILTIGYITEPYGIVLLLNTAVKVTGFDMGVAEN